MKDEPPIDPALPTTVTPSGRVVYDPSKAPAAEVEPGAVEDLQKVLAQMRAIESADARDAVPEPVEIVPAKDGTMATQPAQEAARAHAEVVVTAAPVPAQVERVPVKIQDPRRLPTIRIERKLPDAAEGAKPVDRRAKARERRARAAEQEVMPVARRLPPAVPGRDGTSAGASGARRPSRRGAVWIVLAAAACAVIVFLALRQRRHSPSPTAVTAAPSASAPGTTAAPSATAAASATSIESAPATSPSAAPDVEPSATAAASESAPASAKTAPTSASDPYGDAGSPSVKSTPTAEPPATAPPATAPPATSPPASVAPTTGGAPAPSATPKSPDDEFYIRTKKKDAAKP